MTSTITIELLSVTKIVNRLIQAFGNRVSFKSLTEDRCSFEINDCMFFFLNFDNGKIYIQDSPGESYSLWIKRVIMGEKI